MRRSSSESLSSVVRRVRRDDRVVVADLVVGDDALQRQQVEALDVGGGGLVVARRAADVAGDGLQLGDHVARQKARARPRIGEHLVLLVAALGGGERAAGGEAEAAVGLALQRREVVEQRRLLGALLALELGDLAGLAARRRRRPRRPPRRSCRRGLRRRGSGPRTCAPRAPRRARRRASRARARTRGSPPRGA